MRKLIIAILVVCVLAVLFVGCTRDEDEDKATTTVVPTTTVKPTTTVSPAVSPVVTATADVVSPTVMPNATVTATE